MVEVKVPSVGESISEVTIASWLKNDGDMVKLDEVICSIESDKATLEISAPKAGKLKLLVKEGETVAIGTKIAEVDETASAGAATETKQEVKPTTQEAPLLRQKFRVIRIIHLLLLQKSSLKRVLIQEVFKAQEKTEESRKRTQ